MYYLWRMQLNFEVGTCREICPFLIPSDRGSLHKPYEIIEVLDKVHTEPEEHTLGFGLGAIHHIQHIYSIRGGVELH